MVYCEATDRATAAKIEDAMKDAADLYRVAFLLTGRSDISIDIASDVAVLQDDGNPFFAAWMRTWSRRIAISKAIATIRDELADSARRTKLAPVDRWAAPPPNWSLSPDRTMTEIEEALLAIDLFSRAVLLLLIFEGVRIRDVAILLDADVELVRKAQVIGLRELTASLAKNKHHAAPESSPASTLAQATH